MIAFIDWFSNSSSYYSKKRHISFDYELNVIQICELHLTIIKIQADLNKFSIILCVSRI